VDGRPANREPRRAGEAGGVVELAWDSAPRLSESSVPVDSGWRVG